jgi:hypothetical protein
VSPEKLSEGIRAALARAGDWISVADIAEGLGVGSREVSGALVTMRHRGAPIEWRKPGSTAARVRLAPPGTAVHVPRLGRKPEIITLNGESRTIAEWVAHSGVTRAAFYKRLRKGETDPAKLLGPAPRSADTTLLHCEPRRGGCGDIVRITTEPRACRCGQSRAWFGQNNVAELRGPCRALDLNANAPKARGQWRESARVNR